MKLEVRRFSKKTLQKIQFSL